MHSNKANQVKHNYKAKTKTGPELNFATYPLEIFVFMIKESSYFDALGLNTVNEAWRTIV